MIGASDTPLAPLMIAGGSLTLAALAGGIGYAQAKGKRKEKKPSATLYLDAADQVVVMQRSTIESLEARLQAVEEQQVKLIDENQRLQRELTQAHLENAELRHRLWRLEHPDQTPPPL